MLAGDAAVGVAGLHDHAVHRADAMDQRLAVGLDDQDVVRPAREACHGLATADADIEQPDLVAAQDAECRSRHQLVAQAGPLARIVDITIAAMTEEGEVVGLEPAQEVLVLGETRRELRRAAGCQVGDGVEAGPAHRAPVVDRWSNFGQHAGQRGGDLVEQQGIGLAVDLDVHDRFGPRAFTGFERDADQVAVEVAVRRNHRMSEQVNGDLAAIEFVRDRIDQERHVVVDDLHDRMTAVETMVGEGRIEDAHLGDAGQAAAGEAQQGEGGGGTLVDRSSGQILVRGAAEQPARELRDFPSAGLQGGGADGVQPVEARRGSSGHFLCIPLESKADVTPHDDILTTDSWRCQECPSHLAFCGVALREPADSLRFLSLIHGIRGEARFVLMLCCTCEGR